MSGAELNYETVMNKEIYDELHMSLSSNKQLMFWVKCNSR